MDGRFGRNKDSFTPSAEPVSTLNLLERLKGLLEIRFDDTVVNQTLKLCLASAIEDVEEITGRMIRVGTIIVSYECWVGRFPLPFLPYTAVTSVKDWDDVAIEYTQKGQTLTIDAPDGCKITYTGGYGDSCPAPLQMAILKKAVTAYELRSNIAIGTISSKIPESADELMEKYILTQES